MLWFARLSNIPPSTSSHRKQLYNMNFFHIHPTPIRAGIVPSNKTTYTLPQLQAAVKAQTGSIPFFGCGQNGTVLQEVWYFSHVHGTVRLNIYIACCLLTDSYLQEQFGTYKTLDSTTKSTCSTTGQIHYFERTPTSERDVRLLL